MTDTDAFPSRAAGISWPRPKGGFFLRVTLPRGVDGRRMVARAIEEGSSTSPATRSL